MFGGILTQFSIVAVLVCALVNITWDFPLPLQFYQDLLYLPLVVATVTRSGDIIILFCLSDYWVFICMCVHTNILYLLAICIPNLKKKTDWGLCTADKVFVMLDGGPEFRALEFWIWWKVPLMSTQEKWRSSWSSEFHLHLDSLSHKIWWWTI